MFFSMKYSQFINVFDGVQIMNIFPEKPISSEHSKVFKFFIENLKDSNSTQVEQKK